jgi:succinate-acetate transporter protein
MPEVTQKPAPAVGDPGPLGLAGFALTTFVLSVHNANWAPDLIFLGLALFYGGAAQLMAGYLEFRNHNTFGGTAFASYGAFWMSFATFIFLILSGVVPSTLNVDDALAWFLVSFFIFNTYMLLGSLRTNKALIAVFATLEITELILFIAFFLAGSTSNHITGVDLIHVGGYVGVLTAACAWYASAAGVINGMVGRQVLKVGAPLWGAPTT